LKVRRFYSILHLNMTFNFSGREGTPPLLRLQQTRPVVVVECDETVLALERSVDADIVVAAYDDAGPKAAQ
jgi:hypothetical protein